MVGWEKSYEVSSFGRVRTIARVVTKSNGGRQPLRARIKRQSLSSKGYPLTSLKEGNRHQTARVHRLVAMAFIPNPENLPAVNHKDAVKANNHVGNLEWVTEPVNRRHAFGLGLWPSRAKKKLTIEEIKEIRRRLAAIAKEFGVTPRVVRDILYGKTWARNRVA